MAATFQPTDELTVDCDVELKYVVGMRVAEPEDEKLANANGNDGNYNFDQWDMTTNKFMIMADIEANYKNVGLFVRPKAYVDQVYTGSNANYAENPTPNNQPNPLDSFPHETQKAHGSDVELLDAFVFAAIPMAGERILDVRVGDQVLQWGESLKFPGIGGAMTPLDIAASAAPGIELKELYLPTGAVSAQLDVIGNLSVAGYYQYEWEKNRFYESGSYFSTTDFLDEAGRGMIVGPGVMLPRLPDEEPSDQGQYGVALRYFADQLMNGVEMGLYYINYHDKGFKIDFAPTGYRLIFGEDTKLYGASLATTIGPWSVAGEVSYQTDYLASSGSSAALTDILQAQIQGVWAGIPPIPLVNKIADRWSLATEFVCVDLIDSEVPEENINNDPWAWGYFVKLTPSWYQVLPGLDIDLPISWNGAPNGTAVNSKVTEGSESYSVGLDFTYHVLWKWSITYADYVYNESKSDRDYLSFTISYSF